jgi:hypothetical protein
MNTKSFNKRHRKSSRGKEAPPKYRVSRRGFALFYRLIISRIVIVHLRQEVSDFEQFQK